ncbi:MAG: DUF1801 domain-containing protein [Propionicimonas sp.]
MTTFADLIDEAGDAGPALSAILDTARSIAPDAVEGTSYGVPALFHAGLPLVGLARNAKGFALYPFSGAILVGLSADLSSYRVSKGALGFNADQRLPQELVRAVVEARRDQIDELRQ